MIGFSDLIELWVIKIRKSIILQLRAQYVKIMGTEQEMQITQREHVKGLLCSQNNKIVMIIKHGRHEF